MLVHCVLFGVLFGVFVFVCGLWLAVCRLLVDGSLLDPFVVGCVLLDVSTVLSAVSSFVACCALLAVR